MRRKFFIILIISFITPQNDRCQLNEYSFNNISNTTSRSYYDVGDTLSVEDQLLPYSVCYSDGNYPQGGIFQFNDFNGNENGGSYNVILVSMNATW